jgi:nucleotide-binding universal stress UspA family protein
MSTKRSDPIVVGIDGSTAAAKALDWAADEAQRRRLPLVIAYAGHIVDRTALVDRTARDAIAQICDYGRELLDDAVSIAVENRELVDVKTELREVSPAQLLIGLSETASALVVGRGDGGHLARFIFGSTTQRVAEHAYCPVVVVGADGPSRASDTIVVGASESTAGEAALQFAGAEAVVRGASLLLVRSWTELNWPRVGFPFPPEARFHSARDAEQARLDRCVQAAREAFPRLQIDGRLTEQPAYVALETAAHDAALLVIGCRRPEDSHLLRLGPLSSWLLHHCACPVAIVGQQTAAAMAHEATVRAPHRIPVTVPRPAG